MEMSNYEKVIDKQIEIDSYVKEAKKVLNMYTVKMQEGSNDLDTDEVAIFAATMALVYKSLTLTSELMKDIVEIKGLVTENNDKLREKEAWDIEFNKLHKEEES